MSEQICDLVARARAAQQAIEYWPQEKVDRMVAAVGWELYREENAAQCARLAHAETRMGVYEDKLAKHRKKTLGVLRDLQGVKTVGVIETDEARGLMKIAKPVGVVASITPVTNPSSTLAVNGLALLKTRNAVIFGPHLFARRTTELTVGFMRAGLEKAGAPTDLVQILPKPTKERIQELMAAADLVVATGSAGLVKAAYSSGTPAYGVGAGNAVTVVDETADLADAARKIALSKTFDNATSCSSENSIVVQEALRDRLVAALQAQGGHLCTPAEKAALKAVMWPDGATLNPRIVARPAAVLAEMAGIAGADAIRFLLVVGEQPLEDDLFAREKLSPVSTLWTYGAFSEAVETVERIIRNCGYGHSCGIHSSSEEHILELATKAHVSRMLVCQPQCFGNSGNFDNGMPFTLTLGCGTWGGNITSEGIVWKHFLNTTWVSRPIAPVVPDEETIFGEYWTPPGT